MTKGFRFILSIIIPVLFITSINGQEKKYNSQYQPLPVIMRLSYENFRNIKLLQTAIINYGGGEADIEKLIDQYSEASALYFENKYVEAANAFTENSREILKISQALLRKYKSDTEVLVKKGLKFNIKKELKNSLKGKKPNKVNEKLLDGARFGLSRAQDTFDKFINATNAPPRRLIEAIFYLRRSKENIFIMYMNSQMDPDEAKDKEMKNQFREQYKKDMQDNKNKIFVTKEKKN